MKRYSPYVKTFSALSDVGIAEFSGLENNGLKIVKFCACTVVSIPL